ncbi:hypothetical protein DSCO28_02300 [Desulfosarcina ovata subsp. sediminis]|uniref:LysM domain-containing protein n=2 Tax=Desulfosarcina ovata TaxID=83564 RepID=A0A5K7ZEI5_9BACT|nr:hypothetical protein DSCO28_02300 [Desulfosarcina ovata subsp. sediminis]
MQAGVVMQHKVKQGECLSSIAAQHGFDWEKIWQRPENDALKQLRQDPNILMPGDHVFIPDKEIHTVAYATEQRHRFRKKGVPVKLRVRFLDNDQPRANERYVLKVDGKIHEGTTDSDGMVQHNINPKAVIATLYLGEEMQEFPLDLGRLDPVNEISGVQARLNNLGFSCDDEFGTMGPETKAAIRQFQLAHGLTASGEIDSATQGKLLKVHGC